MENLKTLISVVGIVSGIMFTTTNANADKKDRGKKPDKEVKAKSFSFDKDALIKLEMQLITDYLAKNVKPKIADRTVKIYTTSGILFFEGRESILAGNTDEYDFLFEYEGVSYYHMIE